MIIPRQVLAIETRKLMQATVTRVATAAALLLVTLTVTGGYAAATLAPGSQMGSKAASLMTTGGWAGLTGLAAVSTGVTSLLAAGIVMAWLVGREFTDGTVVGLFALPVSRSAIALAKVLAAAAWASLLAVASGLLTGLAGIAGTLGMVVVTNLASGFGIGGFIPWAVPVLWATPGSGTDPLALVLPLAVGIAGAFLTARSWEHLQLGDR